MPIYKKKESMGNFLKKGEDIKDGDLVELLDEGKNVEGDFGPQDIFTAKTEEGKEGNLSLNQTSINNLIDAFGENSKKWMGKEIKVWLVKQNIQGKIKTALYLSHPDAVLNEEGVFTLEGKQDSVKEESEIET